MPDRRAGPAIRLAMARARAAQLHIELAEIALRCGDLERACTHLRCSSNHACGGRQAVEHVVALDAVAPARRGWVLPGAAVGGKSATSSA